MPWFDDVATPTQLERVTQIKLANQQGLIPTQELTDEEQARFIYLIQSVQPSSATKGSAGELIGLVKKVLADAYESQIKTIEVE
jgi:hypothetical protein